MRQLKAEPVTTENFSPYGSFCDMINPKGYGLNGEFHTFYPDRVTGAIMGNIAFSPITVKRNDMIVKNVEFHASSWEGIFPIDDDMVIHVAPASGGTPVPKEAKAFIVPQGTFVKMNAAIWHMTPYPLHKDFLHAMIVLPECTYIRDCPVMDIEEKDWYQIII